MTEKARRFDLYPDDFIAGVAGELTPPEMGVYSMVILLCYSHGGSVPYDPELLRNKFRPSTGGWAIKRHLDRLIAIGKIVRDGNEITVSRVRDEVERSISRIRVSRENGVRGGRPSNKNNDEAKGLGFPARVNNHHTSYSSNPVADATGADAPSFDPVKEIFDRGLKILGQAQRSLLGKLRKQHGDVAVLEAICACESEHPTDPAPFLIRSCKAHSAPKRKSPSTTLWEGAYNAAQNYIRDHGIDRDDNLPAQPLLDSGRPPRIA